MDQEIWKPVPSIPGLEASSWGRVRRMPFERSMPNGGSFLSVPKPTFGYKVKSTGLARFRMSLYSRGLGNRNIRIARAVCEAFHGPPRAKQVAMHIDDDPANNRPENLKWGTQKENLNSKQFIDYCKSRTGENSPTSKGRWRRQIGLKS